MNVATGRSQTPARCLVLASLFLGCGGKLVDTDAGPAEPANELDGSDGALEQSESAAADAVIACSVEWVDGGSAEGGCWATASWSCGSTNYFVDCLCFAEPACTCSAMMGQQVLDGSDGPSPSCLCGSTFVDLATFCGFPH